MNHEKVIYWIDLNRFDLKPDKSTWLEMSDTLSEYGFYVYVLTGYGHKRYSSKLKSFQVNCFRAWDIGWIFRTSLLLNIAIWLFKNGSKNDIYILHPDSLYIAPFLRLLGRPHIHLDVRTLPVNIDNFKRKVDRLLFWKLPMTLFGRLAKSYSFITEPLKNSVETEFSRKYTSYIIWESGVNTDFFTRTPKNVLPSNKFKLFYHGSIAKNRGINLVVNAMKSLPSKYKKQICFVIVGGGPGLADIKKIVTQESMSEYIEIKGMIPYDKIPQEIATADCCICPLPDREEWNVSSPLKVFEYMASGKPLILTPILAHKNILTDQDFVVWSKGDQVEDFVGAIKYAFDSREFLETAAKIAPDFVRTKYDWLCQGKKLANYLNSIF